MNHDPSHHDCEPGRFWRSRFAVGLAVFGAIAGYFLLSEHRGHYFAALPFLLLLACPLMHAFMHRGHGGHGGGQGGPANPPPAAPTDKPGEPP